MCGQCRPFVIKIGDIGVLLMKTLDICMATFNVMVTVQCVRGSRVGRRRRRRRDARGAHAGGDCTSDPEIGQSRSGRQPGTVHCLCSLCGYMYD